MFQTDKVIITRSLFFFGAAFLMGYLINGCSGLTLNLPDRTKCTRTWEQGKECVSNVDCNESLDEVCAFRGHPTGRCVMIDCCDPWRSSGSHAFGDDWCKKEAHPGNDNFQRAKKTPKLQQ
jgi:hypothetical protein